MRQVNLSGLIGKIVLLLDRGRKICIVVGFGTDADDNITPTVFLLDPDSGLVFERCLTCIKCVNF